MDGRSNRAGTGSARRGLAGIAVVCVAAVGVALFAQHRLGMQPCPWCILQRLIFLGIAVVAGLGALTGGRQSAARLASALTVPLAVAGAASAAYQHFVAAKSASCNLTLADRIVSFLHLDTAWPAVFEVRASCADAVANLAGVPFDFWSLALFTLLAMAGLWGALRAGPPPR